MFQSSFSILLAGVSSLAICAIILITAKWHGVWSMDQTVGAQKFHQQPTPRIGGLAIIGACFLGFVVNQDVELINTLRPILVCGLIPFFFGFHEDVSKNGSVFQRLLASVIGAGAVIWLTGIHLDHIDLWGLDQLLSIPVVSILFTLFAVAGLTNAINIMDGFNGLASGVAAIILLSFVLMAVQVGDYDLAEIALILASAILGFMVFNYPFGKIFLGDSGAYFIGFMLAWLAILLPMRNPEISPWASLLACAYPVWEAVFSMYRRIKNKSKTTRADSEHLHSLIKRRWVRKYLTSQPVWFRNASVAPLIWVASLILAVIAWRFMREPIILILSFMLFVLLYVAVYKILSRMPDPVGGSGN